MSQITSYVGNAAPGAGIKFLVGSGTDVPPTAGGRVTIAGAGGLVVTGAGNTITINNPLAAAQFQTDGDIANPLAGTLNIVGAAHQLTTSAPGAIGNRHTVEIGFTNDVTMPHNLTVVADIQGNGNIDAVGTVSGAIVDSRGVVHAAHGLRTTDGGLIVTLGGITSTGTVTLTDASLPNFGLVQMNGAHQLIATMGAVNTFLISRAPAAATWGTITSASLVITHPGNDINLELGPNIKTVYHTDGGDVVSTTNTLNVVGGSNIHTDTPLDNTIRMSLTNNVTIGGVLQVNGSVSCAGAISGHDLVSAASTQTNTLTIGSASEGIARIDSTKHVLGMTPTAVKQIVVSTAAAPGMQWSTLTNSPTVTIAVDEIAHTTTFNAVGGGANYGASAWLNSPGVRRWGHLPIQYLGQDTAILTALYPGIPANHLADSPARYQAFAAGVHLYNFTFTLGLIGARVQPIDVTLVIQRGWPGTIHQYTYLTSLVPQTVGLNAAATFTQAIVLNQGESVVFGVLIDHASPVLDIGFTDNTFVSGSLLS